MNPTVSCNTVDGSVGPTSVSEESGVILPQSIDEDAATDEGTPIVASDAPRIVRHMALATALITELLYCAWGTEDLPDERAETALALAARLRSRICKV